MRRRLLTAIAASLAVVLAAPFVGEIRGAVQAAFPGHYRAIVGGVVVAVVAFAVAAAVVHIRERRALRLCALAAALAIGIVYARATSSGNPDVDVVEHFHFVEYGLIALLFHRVWSERNDVTTFALPLLAGILVGTLDEWYQWFIPGRVGEMRDVLLNGVAIGCGLLFGIGLYPPRQLTAVRDRRSRATLAGSVAIIVALCGLFLHSVHMGYEVRDKRTGTFLSRFSSEELLAAARDRSVRWRGGPPVQRGLTREDQYLSEGLWHIQRRNEAFGDGDAWAAWHEDQILEAFYQPVLSSVPGTQWLPEQRADARERAEGVSGAYISQAHPFPIYVWNRRLFWATVTVVVAAVMWWGVAPRRARAAVRSTV